MPSPDFGDFVRLAATGDLVPVWREFLFDADTAVTAYAKLARQAADIPDLGAASPRFGFLLESVVGGEKWARYTFLGTAPREAWRLAPGGQVSRWTPTDGWSEPVATPDPLGDLDRLLRSRTPVSVPGLPRFFGGAVGYLAYDVVRYIEQAALGRAQATPRGTPDAPRGKQAPSAEGQAPASSDSVPTEPPRAEVPDAPPDDLGLPEALVLFTDVVLAIDNLFGRAYAIATVDVTGGPGEQELRRRYDRAAAKLDAVVHTLATAPAPEPLALAGADADVPFDSSYTRQGFEADVRRIKDYIAAGDAFQVVLSQRLTMPLETDPLNLYRALRSLNPSPYLYFLELDGLAIVGSSPEALVRVEDRRVVVRPIAGTRPRGMSDDEDAALAAELRADEKERAEHLMLVDLGRNDVGRVARFGTIHVPEFMAVETYSHVLHLVSQVEGELREGLSAMDVFRACFPAGTVSGAPKIRAMQIIDELEPVRRGPYAGAVGYFAYGGQAMDTAIAIRTLIAADGRAHVQAGAGVVADSVPAGEYEETLAKARALLRVLRMVRRTGDT